MKPTPCLACKRTLTPAKAEGCAHIECPLRKQTMHLPSDCDHEGYTPMLDGYVSRPRLEE
jgi:hypothetical protein